MEIASADRDALVVRHNKLIESRHKLSLTERKFILWIISQTSRNDKVLKKYRIHISEWIEFFLLHESHHIYAIFQLRGMLRSRKNR